MTSDSSPSDPKNKNKLMKGISVFVLGMVVVGLVLSVAGCIEKTYTVTYAPGTHGTFSPQITGGLSSGSRTPTPPIITGAPGYSFNGWSPSVKSTVTENVTYTAQWIKDPTYTVTYMPGAYGTFPPQVTSGLANGSKTPTAPTVTGTTGYIFNGWSPSVKSTVTENITYTAQWIKEPPNATVTSKNCRTDIVGLHYYTYVDANIHNYGGSGTVVVWTKVTQGNKEWTKSQSVNLAARESKSVSFTFIEPSFWDSNSIYYQVWVENVN